MILREPVNLVTPEPKYRNRFLARYHLSQVWSPDQSDRAD